MPPPTWHSLTVIPQRDPAVPIPPDGFAEIGDDLAIAAALNYIDAHGGSEISVLPISSIAPVLDAQGISHFHWVRILYKA